MAEELSGTVLVLATSFRDDLQTNSIYKGEAEKLLKVIEERSGGRLTIEYRCGRNPKDELSPAELDGVVAVIADMEDYERPFLGEVSGTLRLIARYGVGHNGIDKVAATESGVMVTNSPGCNSMPTAEWSVDFIGAVGGRLPLAHNAASLGEPKDGRGRRDKSGSTIGIVGTGGIGSKVARLLLAYDNIHILASDPYPNEELAADPRVRYVDDGPDGLYELCRESDIITLHAATKDEKPLITRKHIALMKPSAFLVNCARFYLVDYDAVWEAVNANATNPTSGIWGYGVDDPWMDPKTKEKLIERYPIVGLNMVFGPHIGSDTPLGKIGMQMMSAMAVEDFLVYARVPYNVVNPDVLEHSRFNGLAEAQPGRYRLDFARTE